jgi:hypothetical protein
VSTHFTTKAPGGIVEQKQNSPGNGVDGAAELWRRVPESNRAKRICNPLHNRFANAPCAKKREARASLFETGAGKESRTLDLNLGKVALYQLSYARI